MGGVEGRERRSRPLSMQPYLLPHMTRFDREDNSCHYTMFPVIVSRSFFVGSLVSPHHGDAGRARTQAARLFVRATKTSRVVSGEGDGCSTSLLILPSSPPTCPDAITGRDGGFGAKFVIRLSSSREGRRRGKRFDSCVPLT